MKRLPARSASVGALFLLTSCTITVAQQPPSDAPIPPAEASPAPASPQNEAVPPTDATTVDKPASECKSLAEKPCRKNKVSRDVAIGRGENARNTVTYTNIVRDIVPIADWTGKPIARTIPLERYKDYDGVAVLLQAGSPSSPGAILGAGRVVLR